MFYRIEHIRSAMTEKNLSRPEEIVLMAVWKLEEEAYGVLIRRWILEKTGQAWSIGAVYVPLERLENKGLLRSSETEPQSERGGRRKRVFSITRAGIQALDELQRMNSAIWGGYREWSKERSS
jgi:PadR family transcriptional regulator PadR